MNVTTEIKPTGFLMEGRRMEISVDYSRDKVWYRYDEGPWLLAGLDHTHTGHTGEPLAEREFCFYLHGSEQMYLLSDFIPVSQTTRLDGIDTVTKP